VSDDTDRFGKATLGEAAPSSRGDGNDAAQAAYIEEFVCGRERCANESDVRDELIVFIHKDVMILGAPGQSPWSGLKGIRAPFEKYAPLFGGQFIGSDELH